MRLLVCLFAFTRLTPAAVLPFVFEPNVGQSATQVRFLARGSASTLWMTQREIVLGINSKSRIAVLRMRFDGANLRSEITGERPTAGISSYFQNSDPKRWRRSVPHFGKVRYREIYPGTDVEFYGDSGNLEYDLTLEAGADPGKIILDFAGASHISLDSRGDLVLRVGNVSIRHHKPRVYQGETAVEGHYKLLGKHRVGFQIARYDHARPLVIDPVLTYATYLGGQNADSGSAIAMDAQGFLYVTGSTASPDFPILGGLSKALDGPTDAFVAKLNPAASGSAASLIWSTYLGGSQLDAGLAIAVDGSGAVYLAGITDSPDFPIQNAFQSIMQKDSSCPAGAHGLATALGTTCLDIFVAKLAPAGNTLVYSSYLGGAQMDVPSSIAVDSTGRAYVAGQTFSINFPVRGQAIQNTLRGPSDAFLAQISPDGGTLLYSSYLGGSSDDFATSLALDSSGNAVIGGATLSADLPTQGAYIGTPPSPENGFIAKVDLSPGTSLPYLTYLGAPNGGTVVWGVGVDTAGNLYAAGNTNSPTFPVSQSAFQSNFAGQNANDSAFAPGVGDGFVTKLNPALQGSAQLIYASYLGGSSDEFVTGLAVDTAGRITIGGGTNSSDFPTTAGALQCCYDGAAGNSKGFLARVDPFQSGAASLLYSTYLEGSSFDQINGLAVSSAGNSVAIIGSMDSSNLPVTPSAYQNMVRKLGAKGEEIPSVYIALFDFSSSGPVITEIENGAALAAIQSASLSPGLIFTVKGTALGPDVNAAPFIDSNTGLVANNVSGVQVLVDGAPAPLLYISPVQINAVAPYALVNRIGATVRVQVIYNGIPGNLTDILVQATAPGIFSLGDGSGQGAIRNADGSVNGAGNPAAKGSFISIYATGEGQLSPPGVDGQLASSPLPAPTAPVSLSIGNVAIPAANILYAGTTLFEGFFQVNAILPASVPSGNMPVLLTIGSATSQPGLTVEIQ